MIYDENSAVRFNTMKRLETELKWIKLLQSASPLGINDNIYQEGNISKMPAFGVFSLLEIRKRKRRSHGKRQKGNDKRKRCAAQKSGTSLNNLSSKLREHGRHAMLSFLISLPIPVFRILGIEANNFERNSFFFFRLIKLDKLMCNVSCCFQSLSKIKISAFIS